MTKSRAGHIRPSVSGEENLLGKPRGLPEAPVALLPMENRNVLGGPLIPCSLAPLTGFYRDGACRVGPDDLGCHAVCCGNYSAPKIDLL